MQSMIFFISFTLLQVMYVFVWTPSITFTRVKIFKYALLKFLKKDEWNDSHALVVVSESIEFIANGEGGKVKLEKIYVSIN